MSGLKDLSVTNIQKKQKTRYHEGSKYCVMDLQRAYRTVRLCVFMHLMLVVAAPDLLLLLLCFDFFVSHTHLVCLVCKVEPRGLIARRVTEVAQSTLDMVTTAVDYPLCEHCFFLLPLHGLLVLCSLFYIVSSPLRYLLVILIPGFSTTTPWVC